MSIAAITFDMDEHIVQLVNGDMLIWVDSDTSKEADIVIPIADMRRILDSALMLRREP
jgi:hypothetical protein